MRSAAGGGVKKLGAHRNNRLKKVETIPPEPGATCGQALVAP